MFFAGAPRRRHARTASRRVPLLGGRRPARIGVPAGPSTVLLASTGVPFTDAEIRQTESLAGRSPITVLSVARLHGSAFGLPNPGLMPTRRDREQQRDIVAAAVHALERGGRRVDGQVVITRNPAKTIARAARRLQVEHVVLAAPAQSRLRRLVEGDPVAGVRRRLRTAATVSARSPDAFPVAGRSHSPDIESSDGPARTG